MDYQIFYPILDKYGGPFILGLFTLLLLLERKYPLRRFRQPYLKRLILNVLVAFPTFIGLRLILIPLVVLAGALSQKYELGILYLFDLPVWAHALCAFFLLDYILYLWHVVTHKFQFLWRLHNVHHTDLDLTAATAFRFHVVEIIYSAFFRAAGAALIGATPVTILIYEVIFQMSVSFHHSNVRLPQKIDEFLTWFIVTPRMHGIHHSVVHEETDSNYSNVFSIWDRIHKTLKLRIPQNKITIGVPAYQKEKLFYPGELLLLPFKKQPDYWKWKE